MKETLICSLEKHNIYYLSDANVSFYILVPYKEYDNTNISIRLKSNYDSYDLTKNSHIREQNVLQFVIYQTADQCLKLRYKSFFAYFHYKTLAKHIVFCYNNNVQTSALMG